MSSSAVEGLKSRLAAHLTASDGQKSSHWKQYTAGRSVTAQNGIAGIWGFGTRVTRSMHRRAAHFLLQRHLLGWTNPIFRASSYAAASRYCVAQRRVLDMDVLRHCFTVELLKDWQDRLDRPKGLCVIGDGQANLVTATLHARLFPKVLSVNLADVLLNDLEVMLADGLLSDREICLVESVGDLDHFWNDPLIKVGLLCADQADLIRGRFPGLFVNIASFQEMTPGIVANYFEIIQSNRAALYCCNRERKVLPGGETLVFAEYPWEGARILMDERCPWHQQFYATRPPFLRSYDGPMRHRIATWKAESD